MVMLLTLDLSVILSTANMSGEFTFATHIHSVDSTPKICTFSFAVIELEGGKKSRLISSSTFEFWEGN